MTVQNGDAKELPRVPYASLEAALNHFHEAGGAPSELHGSVFPRDKFSGTTIALLVKAFKQFGMENADGTTNHKRLDPLIDPSTRKVAFQALLKEIFGTLIALPIESASPNQFNKWFSEYHMNSEDERKAKTFFLHAAKANDVLVSPFIQGRYKTRSRAAGKPKREKRPAKPPATSRKASEQDDELVEPGDPMLDKLLEKFPAFDPAWSSEVQAKWFEAFGKLQDQMTK